ncbi:tetratricopeptide repeat protein [Azospirillum canadense]|uniref:tetratricopeptide repeat protein n=1 Tax=Azospirillum canadense TaxID=403962 RepID=UPI002227E48B|nr:tetratricopeptide repeat protein [Azospirillum canadense]MCW2243722.1 putative TPR repeat methyltransferase [Azospirillum canadense]
MTEPSTPFRLGGFAAKAQRLFAEANALAEQGCAVEAESVYRRALALDPRLAEAHNNLGNVLRALGRAADAVAAYQQTLACGLDHPLVHYNLASALKAVGEAGSAERSFRRALAMRPDYAEAFNNLANLLREQDRLTESADVYRRALALRPDWDEAHDNLSGALYLLHEDGRTEEAGQLARLWLRDHPDHPVARHIGAALAGFATEDRASDAYVRQVFDHFAGEFETKLAELGYRAPGLLADALRQAMGVEPDGILAVLDAGCGTGLCAPFLRPWARRLVGVDLSPGMLDHARARGLYDGLAEAELGAFLAGQPGAFDLIVAADVLCYFGALDAVLAQAAAALRPGGRLAFTVERLEEAAEPHRVSPHGRYAHAEGYVRGCLGAAGLGVARLSHDTLRFESGEPVDGLVVVAVREVES